MTNKSHRRGGASMGLNQLGPRHYEEPYRKTPLPAYKPKSIKTRCITSAAMRKVKVTLPGGDLRHDAPIPLRLSGRHLHHDGGL